MQGKAASIIFSNLNENTSSEFTSLRTVASIPFACRYRLIDFSISNLTNAGITNVNIVTNYNYRSLLEHIGSGKDYDLALRRGGIKVITPLERSPSSRGTIFTTRMEALISIENYIKNFNEELCILADADTVLNFDLNDAIKFHKQNNATVTFISALCDTGFSSKSAKMMISKRNNRIIDLSLALRYNKEAPDMSLNIFIINTTYLKKMIELSKAHNSKSLTSILLSSYKNERYFTYMHDGFYCTISNLDEYYKNSMTLLNSESARRSLLANNNRPIYTRVHNSSPTSHTEASSVVTSLIADDCVIEGTVKNSVIFRGVHIGKGAYVENSILFHGTKIEGSAKINCIVTDKNVIIGRGVKLSGTPDMPFYIEKERRVVL